MERHSGETSSSIGNRHLKEEKRPDCVEKLIHKAATIAEPIFKANGWEWRAGVPGYEEICNTLRHLINSCKEPGFRTGTGRFFVARDFSEDGGGHHVYLDLGSSYDEEEEVSIREQADAILDTLYAAISELGNRRVYPNNGKNVGDWMRSNLNDLEALIDELIEAKGNG